MVVTAEKMTELTITYGGTEERPSVHHKSPFFSLMIFRLRTLGTQSVDDEVYLRMQKAEGLRAYTHSQANATQVTPTYRVEAPDA